MKIYKIALGKLYEGDRIRAYFRGKPYEGEIASSDIDDGQNMYWINFDLFNELSKRAEAETDKSLYDLLDWMEDAFYDKSLELVSAGDRWEDIKGSELELNECEDFSYGGRAWDVRKAKRILYKNPRPKVMFPVRSVKSYIDHGLINTGRNYRDADLNIPLILISSRGDDVSGQFPIDGWHRIRKALENGVKELPAYVLNGEESKEIWM